MSSRMPSFDQVTRVSHFCSQVPKDPIQSLELLQQAAHSDAEAQFLLAIRYQEGDGVGRDAAKAVHLFMLAATAGHAAAQFNLGVCFDDGLGVAVDESKAKEWYIKAAAQGFSAAQVMLDN